jgi:hypothetical protein
MEIALTAWSKCLHDHDRSLLNLDGFFELPYKDLSRTFKDNKNDMVLRCLALMRLGSYYFDKGRMTEMANIRQEVATGLSELLGQRHPLTLQAASDAVYIFLFNQQPAKAQSLHAEVAIDH